MEFLNQVLSRLEVKEGIVRGDGQPWLVLGPVYGGYEPIVFRNGRFLLQDAAGASRPVVKVTGTGIAAYALFYGKRLPTEVDWLRAASRGKDPLQDRRKDRPELARGTDNLEKEMEAWWEHLNKKPARRMPLRSSAGRLCHRMKNRWIHLKIRVPQMFPIRCLPSIQTWMAYEV